MRLTLRASGGDNDKEIANGKKVEEYYWAGKMVVYVDNLSVEMTFEAACDAIREGRELTWTPQPLNDQAEPLPPDNERGRH